MIYNGVTEYLRLRFAELEKKYYEWNQQERADTGRSCLFVKRFFYDEMAYKVLYLVDREFDSFGAYLDAVRELVPVRRSYVVRSTAYPELLAEAERECLAFLDGVKETDTAEPDGYCRVILGEERERLEYAILEKWGYCVDYWYPLKGSFDEQKLFLNVEYLEPYWDRLCSILGLPEQRVYDYGESFFDDGQLSEVDTIVGCGGNETAYLPKDLSWIIYFSHEETVTFAGGIVSMVKELLYAEREHWNRWD